METENTKSNLCFCVHGAAQILSNPQVRKALALPELEEELSLSEQVREIKKSLTLETWNKGGWFKVDGEYNIANRAVARTADDIADARRAAAQTNNLFDLWNNRPDCVRKDSIGSFDGLNRGKTELSYLLGMFGLTISFNDAKTTTLEMLHAKLDKVINFAEEYEI